MSEDSTRTAEVYETFVQRYADKRSKFLQIIHSYVDSRFTIGSVAEVEWQWPIFYSLLGVNRKYLTPIVFKALVFLKVNSSYWNQNTVPEALRMTKTKRTSERIFADDEHEELQYY